MTSIYINLLLHHPLKIESKNKMLQVTHYEHVTLAKSVFITFYLY